MAKVDDGRCRRKEKKLPALSNPQLSQTKWQRVAFAPDLVCLYSHSIKGECKGAPKLHVHTLHRRVRVRELVKGHKAPEAKELKTFYFSKTLSQHSRNKCPVTMASHARWAGPLPHTLPREFFYLQSPTSHLETASPIGRPGSRNHAPATQRLVKSSPVSKLEEKIEKKHICASPACNTLAPNWPSNCLVGKGASFYWSGCSL